MAKIDMPTSSLNKTPGQQPKKKLEKVTTGKVTVRQQTDIQKVATTMPSRCSRTASGAFSARH